MVESWGEMLTGVPEVWEDWREIVGGHTCDKRSSRVSLFPIAFEEIPPVLVKKDSKPQNRQEDSLPKFLSVKDYLFPTSRWDAHRSHSSDSA